MNTNTVHDLDTLYVGDLVLNVAPPTDRSTLEIVVERDASLVLKAPRTATVDRAEQFISSRRSWIYRKLAEKDALIGPAIVKQFVDGEGFAYLGRSYRLSLEDCAVGVRLDRGRFIAPSCGIVEGSSLMKEWYTQAGARWLRHRIRPWAARLGLEQVSVHVRDLGFRWGSARPTDDDHRINIHWSTVQLPPSLIDYVLVHELAHLREANHTTEFWSIVGQLMPGYESHKASLAAIGRGVWLGEVND